MLIATYNRAALLAQTLDRLAAVRPQLADWDVVVVDNNSTDGTRAVVESRIGGFPVPLRYMFERAQGRSPALNTGIAATTAPLLIFTDDDVIVGDDWLDAAAAPLLDDSDIGSTGGPVRPIWESRGRRGCRPIARTLGHDRDVRLQRRAVRLSGSPPRSARRQCGRARRVSSGSAISTDARPSNGRQLLGQEVPELLARSRAAGARGL